MRRLTSDEIPGWVRDVLLSPDRRTPVVAVTSHPRTSHAWVPPEDLQAALGDRAEVVFLETGDATWALSEALPPRLDVYGGAMRIWWPGLTRESEPYEHRLYFVFSPQGADSVIQQIVAAVRERTGGPPAPREAASPRPRPAAGPVPAAPLRAVAPEEPETVRVTAVAPGRIEVSSPAHRGVVTDAELPVNVYADGMVVGCEFRARPLRPRGDGTWDFSISGTVPNAWQRFAAEVRPGHVVQGRVQNVHEGKGLVFVDVMPGVVGVCHVSELDYGRVADMSEYARPGDLLAFEVKQFDLDSMSLQLSRKAALSQKPQPLPALIEGGRPFEWRPWMPQVESLRQRRARGESPEAKVRLFAARPASAPAADRGGGEQIEALEAELSAANDERANLVAQIRELRLQVQAVKKEMRAGEDRFEALQRRLGGELDPLSSETAFLLAVRLSYARQFGEDDRQDKPLQRMRVGPHFLASLRALDGIDMDKVLEVCAQVTANVAHTIPARDVHQLRAGSRGAGSRTRVRDGAQAWRCALQLKTPSARRLHWWAVPSPDGATIEFASVGVHDEFDIPD